MVRRAILLIAALALAGCATMDKGDPTRSFEMSAAVTAGPKRPTSDHAVIGAGGHHTRDVKIVVVSYATDKYPSFVDGVDVQSFDTSNMRWGPRTETGADGGATVSCTGPCDVWLVYPDGRREKLSVGSGETLVVKEWAP